MFYNSCESSDGWPEMGTNLSTGKDVDSGHERAFIISIVLNVHLGVTIVRQGEQVLPFGLSSDLLTPNTSITNTKYQSF